MEVERRQTRWYLVGSVKSSKTECTSPSLRYNPSLRNGTAAESPGFIRTNMFPLNNDTYRYPSLCNTQRQWKHSDTDRHWQLIVRY